MKTLTIAVLSFLLGALSVKTAEEVIAPRVMYGYNKVNDEREIFCRQKSQGLLQKVTFQQTSSYYKCINNQKWVQ